MRSQALVMPARDIDTLIMTVRGHRVILDIDLARIYGVPTKRLNEQVKRNATRFPPDFAFRLTQEEANEWLRSRSHFATLKRGQNIKYLPFAFTEHGALMAANVLNSERAVEMSVYVVRAFVRMRAEFARQRDLAKRLAEIERTLLGPRRRVARSLRQDQGAAPPALRPTTSPDRIPRRRRYRCIPSGAQPETTSGSLTMPRIFDNIDQQLLLAFRETIEVSDPADFRVGYLNLSSWKQVDRYSAHATS